MSNRELKTLVRRFLREIQYVPFRAVDCNQDAVDDLRERMRKATRPTRKRRVTV